MISERCSASFVFISHSWFSNSSYSGFTSSLVSHSWVKSIRNEVSYLFFCCHCLHLPIAIPGVFPCSSLSLSLWLRHLPWESHSSLRDLISPEKYQPIVLFLPHQTYWRCFRGHFRRPSVQLSWSSMTVTHGSAWAFSSLSTECSLFWSFVWGQVRERDRAFHCVRSDETNRCQIVVRVKSLQQIVVDLLFPRVVSCLSAKFTGQSFGKARLAIWCFHAFTKKTNFFAFF